MWQLWHNKNLLTYKYQWWVMLNSNQFSSETMIYCNASHLHTNQKLWSVYRHLAKDASSFDILYTQKTKAHTFVHNCKWICKYKWWFHFVNIYTIYCIYIYISGMVVKIINYVCGIKLNGFSFWYPCLCHHAYK